MFRLFRIIVIIWIMVGETIYAPLAVGQAEHYGSVNDQSTIQLACVILSLRFPQVVQPFNKPNNTIGKDRNPIYFLASSFYSLNMIWTVYLSTLSVFVSGVVAKFQIMPYEQIIIDNWQSHRSCSHKVLPIEHARQYISQNIHWLCSYILGKFKPTANHFKADTEGPIEQF